MSTQQLEARTAPEPVAAPAEEAFTASELDAAEQLVHLSESSGSSSGTPPVPPVAAASGGSSPRSVNAPAPAPVPLGGCADWEEDEEQEVAGSQRRVERFRLIAEIYAATEEIGGRAGGGSTSRKNKKK